jgi:hypothetical protein
MLKRFGIPVVALVVLMIFSTAPAQAGVHFGVSVGPAYPYSYAYPYAYNPYYAYPYPAYPYAYPYSPYCGGLGFYWGGHHYGYRHYDHDRGYDRGFRGGHEFHEHGGRGGEGHRR